LKKKSRRDCREQLQNACKPAHWRYDTEDVLQLTVTRTAITYILNFAAAASILRIANRWKLQKRGYYCGSVCPGFASCTEWQQHPLELGAPARHCKYTRKKTELDNLYTLKILEPTSFRARGIDRGCVVDFLGAKLRARIQQQPQAPKPHLECITLQHAEYNAWISSQYQKVSAAPSHVGISLNGMLRRH